MILTDEMHDAVKNSPVGQFIDRLIREEYARNGNTHIDGQHGNVIQELWVAFMSGVEHQQSFSEIKQGIKNASIS